MTTLQGMVRTFIAIELPDEVRDSLQATQDRLTQLLGQHAGAFRWGRPEGMHLTLHFLGDVPVRLLGLFKDAMDRACVGVSPFTLTTAEVGVFPNERRTRVVWVGVGGGVESLHALAAAVNREVLTLGYTPDTLFSPHLTLARVKGHIQGDAQSALAEALSQLKTEGLAPVSFPVDAVSLMQSDLKPGGSIYTRLRLRSLE